MKKVLKLLALVLVSALLIGTVFAVLSSAEEAAAHSDYLPKTVTYDFSDGVARTLNNTTGTNVMGYLNETKDGNLYYVFAPAFNGKSTAHTYLSYRDNSGGNGLVYLGQDSNYASGLAKDCTTSFVTFDFDIATETSIPEYMSISLNGRSMKNGGTALTDSNPAGNLYIGLKDDGGTLEISNNNNTVGGTYTDTGIDISKQFVHITLVLDLRPVIDAAAPGSGNLLKAYLYVNGKFFSEMAHGFSTSTDFINEIRVEIGGNSETTLTSTDTLAIDNISFRQFVNGEYNGNLGAVIADPKKTLADFDCSIYNPENMPTLKTEKTLIAKIGTKGYYSMGELLADAKSGDRVRFMVPAAYDKNGNLAATVGMSSIFNMNYATGLMSDGVIYEMFDESGALIESNKNTAGTELTATVKNKSGTVEFYSDYTTTSVIASKTTFSSGHLVLALNGNTLTVGVSSWFAPGTGAVRQDLEIVGPGSIRSANNASSIFGIAAGCLGCTVKISDVDISVNDTFIGGQVGSYEFNRCTMTWTGNQTCFIVMGGPNRGGYKNSITLNECKVSYGIAATGDARGFFRANTISSSTSDNSGNETVLYVNNSVIDTPNYPLLFSHWNSSNSATNQPTPSLVITGSVVNVRNLVTTGYGTHPTVTVDKDSTINLAGPAAKATGSMTVSSTKTTYSKVTINAEVGSVWSAIPEGGGNPEKNYIYVNLGGKALPLENGSGYVIAKPGVKANITLNSDFNFNFYVPESALISASVDGIDMTERGVVDLGTGTYKIISYDEIAPCYSGKRFTAVMTLTDGRSTYIANYTASVAQYLRTVLASTGDSDTARAVALAAAIVKYADASYKYFNMTEDYDAIAELMNTAAGIETKEIDVSSLTAVLDTTDVAFAVRTAQMNMLSAPTVRVNLNSSYSGIITVGGVSFTVENGRYDGKTYVEIMLPAKNITDTVTIKANGKSGSFNIVAYYNYLGECGYTDAQSLLSALINYGAEARAYQPHVYAEGFRYNETHHWRTCSDPACGMVFDKAEHDYSEGAMCACGSVLNFGMGEGEILGSLGLTENVKTGREDMKYAKVITDESATYVFSSDEASAVKIGNTVLFSFVVRADKATKIRFTVDLGTVINFNGNTKTVEYTVPTQWTRIYLPVSNNGMNSVTVSTEGRVYLAEAKYEDMGAVAVGDLQLKSGMWMIDEFETYIFNTSDGIGAGASIDIIKSGNYLYSIGGGKLTVSNAKDGKVLGTLSGFGTLRQMAITDDGKYAVISGRQNGVYIVSLENPTAPKIISTYNAIEQATGIFTSGDYAFVCNRQYGVEIVDISDPTAPTHVANIHSGEVQSCVVYNNILYAGVWADCGVYMYDLSKLSTSPELAMIGRVTTNGKGDGMSVVKIGDKVYLFAATGQHTYNANNENPAQNLMLGQGNGMDIFDVTDPANAKWISTSKIDGRYYYTGNDYWETEVSYDEESGKWYAYLVNTYNGVYIFDVTNLDAPVRLAHVAIESEAGASPALTHVTRTILTSWDQSKVKRSPVGAIVVSDGKIYIAGAESDVFIYSTPYAVEHSASSESAPSLNVSDSFYDFDNVLTGGTASGFAGGSYTHIATDTQVLAVATNEKYVYVAAGASGVIILDKATLAEVGRINPTTVASGRLGYAQDVKVYGDKLFVAEDVAGLRVYSISEAYAKAPVFLSAYTDGDAAIQVTVASDGDFAVLHMSGNKVRIVNTSSYSKDTLPVANIKINEKNATTNRLNVEGGNMYHHNISTLIADRYVVAWNHVSAEYWIDFGPAGARYSTPEVISAGGTYKGAYKTSISMQGGIVGYEVNGVYYALRVEGINVRVQSDFSGYKYTHKFTASTTGRPTIVGDYIFISERVYGKIAIYTMSGSYMGLLTVDGNPDVIHADGTVAYIPLGYQGLLVVDTQNAF